MFFYYFSKKRYNFRKFPFIFFKKTFICFVKENVMKNIDLCLGFFENDKNIFRFLQKMISHACGRLRSSGFSSALKISQNAQQVKMPPLPKIVEFSVNKLRSQGLEITSENLFETLSHDEYEELSHCLWQPHMQAVELMSDKERRDMIAKYVIELLEYDGQDDGEAYWVTCTLLGSSGFLNNFDLAKILCDSGELEWRSSKWEPFRQRGIKEYRVTQKLIRSFTLASASLAHECGFTKEAVVAILKNKKETRKNEEPVEPPEQKARKKSIGRLSVALRNLKSVAEYILKEITTGKIQLDQWHADVTKSSSSIRFYRSDMNQFLNNQLEKVQASALDALEMHGQEITREYPEVADDIDAIRVKVEILAEALEEEFCKLKKNTLSDIKHLTAK